MDVQRFEHEILKLAFETNARLTPASVAYYLGVPSREANHLLNTLLEEGVLELDSDADGNLYYRVPHQDLIARELEAFEPFEQELQSEEGEREPEGVEVPIAFELVSAEDEDATEAFSPSRHRPPEIHAQRATDGAQSSAPSPSPARSPFEEASSLPPAPPLPPTSAPAYAALDGVVRRSTSSSPSPASPPTAREARRGALFGVARSMEPDAWVGQCGASSVIVTSEARCEPQASVLGSPSARLLRCG